MGQPSKIINPGDKERSAIRFFMKNLGKDFPDLNFETDACAFQAAGEKWLFSTDEFSAEDNFRSHNASVLGWNLAAATISDIHAAGGIPMFFGHSVSIQEDWDDLFIDAFSSGIASCLAEAGAAFLGGDLGMSAQWRYTGIVIGKQMVNMSRRGANEGDLIYMTGNAGAGNLEAALKLYSENNSLKHLLNLVHVSFPVRIKEAGLVRKYAHCCIDSSDGLLRALLDLAGINKKGFSISQIPYHAQGLLACKLLGKPEEMLFMGECGEYELVFTIPPENESNLLSEAQAQNLNFRKLGVMTGDEKMFLNHNDKMLDLTGYSLFARNYKDVKEYINEVVQFINDESVRIK
jgi:thiamine-monophosphate kinase